MKYLARGCIASLSLGMNKTTLEYYRRSDTKIKQFLFFMFMRDLKYRLTKKTEILLLKVLPKK
jgi:hypothetical protein